MNFVDDLGIFMIMDLAFLLTLMEGEDGGHTTSPVELEYPTCQSEGKV